MIKKFTLSLSLIFSTVFCFAQAQVLDSLVEAGVCATNGFCIPNIENMARPKGISIVTESILKYNIRSKFRDSSVTNREEVNRNESLEIKLKFPLRFSESYNIYMGLSYKVEEFEFDNPSQLSNEFHRHIEDRSLRSIGSTFYLDKRFVGRHYLYARASLSLNGDYDSGPLLDYFRSSLTTLYGTKISRSKTWGYGLSYSYRFGRLALYPILHYNKQFNDKWGFEMTLPIKTEVRYRHNEKNYFYFVNRLGGDNYVLTLDQLSQENLFLGKSHFLSLVTYEREIHDFLWFTVSVGMRANINFDLSEENRLSNNREPFVDNKLDDAPILRFGIFVVPPRKWMKAKNN